MRVLAVSDDTVTASNPFDPLRILKRHAPRAVLGGWRGFKPIRSVEDTETLRAYVPARKVRHASNPFDPLRILKPS